MRQTFAAAFVGLCVLAGCDRSGTGSAATAPATGKLPTNRHTGEVVWVDPNQIRPGPIRHESLTAEQIRRITAIHETFSEVDSGTLEKTLEDFQHDENPDREIEIWEQMGKAYMAYCGTRATDLATKKEVFGIVLMRSMASEDDALAHLDLKLLSKDEARKVMRGY